MKRIFTLFFVVSLLSATLWAADATVVESYITAPTGGVKASRSSYNGRYSQWFYRNARSKTSDKLIDNTRSFWLSRTSGNSCYLESTLEGGIKSVAFKWRQFAGGEADNDNGYNFILNICIDNVVKDYISFTGAESYATIDQSYAKTLSIKSNAKLTLQNSSTTSDGTTAGGRLIIGPVTITPYLLYTQKDVTIGAKQQGYYNGELINNTGSEGSISYSSSATGVATINESGVITPVSAGDAIITATWSEGVTTTYTLHVVNNIIAENFSKIKATSQVTSDEWNGDLFKWEVANVRRGVDDTLGLNPRIQATALRKGSGETYIYTNASIEGGVKHVAFDWRQWASATSPLTINVYYSSQ